MDKEYRKDMRTSLINTELPFKLGWLLAVVHGALEDPRFIKWFTERKVSEADLQCLYECLTKVAGAFYEGAEK